MKNVKIALFLFTIFFGVDNFCGRNRAASASTPKSSPNFTSKPNITVKPNQSPIIAHNHYTSVVSDFFRSTFMRSFFGSYLGCRAAQNSHSSNNSQSIDVSSSIESDISSNKLYNVAAGLGALFLGVAIARCVYKLKTAQVFTNSIQSRKS